MGIKTQNKMKFFAVCLIASIATSAFAVERRRLQDPVSALVLAAVLKNPEGFAKAVGGLAKDTVDVAAKAKIINLTDKQIVWYTYNTIAPIKLNTQYRSTMGPHAMVALLVPGFGSMTMFADNKQPGYIIERKGVYSWDGKAVTMIVSDINKKRRLDKKGKKAAAKVPKDTIGNKIVKKVIHHLGFGKRMLAKKIKVVKSKMFKPDVTLKKKAYALLPKLKAKLAKMHK